MAHDKNGKQIANGDPVTLTGKVVATTDDSVTIETTDGERFVIKGDQAQDTAPTRFSWG